MQVEQELIEDACLFGVPDFLDIPDELTDALQKATMAKERQFWLRAGDRVKKDPTTEILLRRAVYAESRCWEMENRAAEMALICNGAAERIEVLEAKLDEVVRL